MRNLHLESLQDIVIIERQNLEALCTLLAQYKGKLATETLSQNDALQLHNRIFQTERQINGELRLLNRHERELSELAKELGIPR